MDRAEVSTMPILMIGLQEAVRPLPAKIASRFTRRDKKKVMMASRMLRGPLLGSNLGAGEQINVSTLQWLKEKPLFQLQKGQ